MAVNKALASIDRLLPAKPPKLKGSSEIDENYIGGKQHANWRKLRNKEVVRAIFDK